MKEKRFKYWCKECFISHVSTSDVGKNHIDNKIDYYDAKHKSTIKINYNELKERIKKKIKKQNEKHQKDKYKETYHLGKHDSLLGILKFLEGYKIIFGREFELNKKTLTQNLLELKETLQKQWIKKRDVSELASDYINGQMVAIRSFSSEFFRISLGH